MELQRGDVSNLLVALANGDSTAEAKLIPLVYKELRRLAHSLLRRERPEHSLNPTALVHEAYLRLAKKTAEFDWKNRAQFFAVPANLMRQILVAHARNRQALRRGGKDRPIPFEEWFAAKEQRTDHILALDEALERLEKIDRRQSRVVELRFFSGLSEAEIADVMDISTRTVKRDWNFAKAWLYSEMSK